MGIYSAVLLMGGAGVRFGNAMPKQFYALSGKPLYLHALQPFLDSSLFHEIILVCPQQFLQQVAKSVKAFPCVRVISGGRTRQMSSLCGIMACCSLTQFVMIHDAVRPFVTIEILQENLRLVERFGAVDTCIASHDTIVEVAPGGYIARIPEREFFQRGQTPQTFEISLIRKAHEQALQEGICQASDDCSLVMRLGHKVAVAKGSECNIKITTNQDLLLAEQILRHHKSSVAFAAPPATLKGRRYIVIGGTGGIGTKICQLLQKNGATIISAARKTHPYAVDVGDVASVRRFFDQIALEQGLVDGLINCAGYLKCAHLCQQSSAEIYEHMAVNFLGVVWSCRRPPLIKGGHILNVSSSCYIKGRKGYAVYAAAKAAVVNFTQGLAQEHPEWHVNALVPARTKTLLRTQNFETDETWKLLQPEEVAQEAVAILASSGITGQVIEVRKNL